ncbi:MAG TPA: PQQ-binding-like beta-propeller repeat protein, partial [Pirellulaceae bacterium]|nr:PQQ-binding-like beta-propeller repeat protein [Pirellulaceae bacterium]
ARPTGRLKWRTRICSSATLGGGELDQLTHLLVTKDGDRLYLNTSAGAVAAVNANDGRLLWLVKYPRQPVRTGNADQPDQHLFRDLTPCLVWKDFVIVAPADCDRIFALHAATGQIAWTLAPGAADDVIHLLGVADDTFLASGDSLYWIDAHTGRLLAQFPRGKLGAEQAAPSPRGFGRGTLADNHVWWPTREAIVVFEAKPIATDFGWQPRLVREIPLAPPQITGGNLVMADGVLLIANGDKLVAFGR